MSETPMPMNPGEPPPALVAAVTRLLRPLIRALIARGLTFPILSRILKEVYVEVAERGFSLEDKSQTDSRVSLLTGIHRKDVRALRGRGPDADRPSVVLSRNAQMIAIWAGAPEYLDARGRPKALPKATQADGTGSFESLVRSVSKDIRPRAILDEWERQRIVTVDEQNFVHLNAAAFIPQENDADLAYYFGRNLRDHIAASTHNLLGEKPALLEQAVYYEKLSEQSVEEIASYSRKLGSDALVKVNRKAFKLAERDKGTTQPTQRISFGIYFLAADDNSAEEER